VKADLLSAQVEIEIYTWDVLSKHLLRTPRGGSHGHLRLQQSCEFHYWRVLCGSKAASSPGSVENPQIGTLVGRHTNAIGNR
jgi:hypothetical protein